MAETFDPVLKSWNPLGRATKSRFVCFSLSLTESDIIVQALEPDYQQRK